MSGISQATAQPRPGIRRAPKPLQARLVALLLAVLQYGTLVLLSCFFILPWLWMISTSLKNPGELVLWPPKWIPNPIRWDNYVYAFRQAAFSRYLGNTLLVTVPSVIGAVASNALAGYGFARVRWPGRDVVFAILLATMILPGFVTFIPLYVSFHRLGWIDTYLPLIVPTFLGNSFFIFLLRQFLMGLPGEISDAARVDGASEFAIFTQVIMPLARPAIAVVALFQFIGSWNDYFGPLIYLNDRARYTISLGIANMQSTYGYSNFAWIMAATCMSVLPIIVLFFFAQRTFIEGIALTGLKG